MARRKLTKALDGDVLVGADLPAITPKQLVFVERLLAGDTASDAYRAAYDTTQCQPETVWANASRLRSDTRVQAWLAAARMAGLGKASVSFQEHLRELERLREIALCTGNVGAAVQAEQLRGKAAGHYTERLEVTSDPQAVVLRLKELLPAVAGLIE